MLQDVERVLVAGEHPEPTARLAARDAMRFAHLVEEVERIRAGELRVVGIEARHRGVELRTGRQPSLVLDGAHLPSLPSTARADRPSAAPTSAGGRSARS